MQAEEEKLGEYQPVAHVMQLVAPAVAPFTLYFPAGQTSQLSIAWAAWYWPLGQRSHAAIGWRRYLPVTHDLAQVADLAVLVSYLPLAHRRQKGRPLVSW